MSVLDEICARKREHIVAQKKQISLEQLKETIKTVEAPRGFKRAIRKHEYPAIIAEIKKASPSVGLIRADFDAVQIAKIYEQSGAACISVLTDEPFFQGRDEYLVEIKKAVSIPLLRKDFILDEYQIYESRALGADCILLIMAALKDDEAENLYNLSRKLKMDVLVEIHDEEELYRAFKFAPAMIGVNNRNLKTLEVDIQTSLTLSSLIHPTVMRIAESGISDRDTIDIMMETGFDGFLIGESLMKEKDIGAALKKFTRRPLDTDQELN